MNIKQIIPLTQAATYQYRVNMSVNMAHVCSGNENMLLVNIT